MKLSAHSGTIIAAAAASLILANAVTAAVAAEEGHEGHGHCIGANACKGESACKTASSACKGQNACKGKGFLELTKEECEAKAKSDKNIKFEAVKG